jgi:hypothetical protein
MRVVLQSVHASRVKVLKSVHASRVKERARQSCSVLMCMSNTHESHDDSMVIVYRNFMVPRVGTNSRS